MSCHNFVNKCQYLLYDLGEKKRVYNNYNEFHVHDVANMLGGCSNPSNSVSSYLNQYKEDGKFHIFVMNDYCAQSFGIIYHDLNNGPSYIYSVWEASNFAYLITENGTECDDKCVIALSYYLYYHYGISNLSIVIHSNDNYDSPQHDQPPVLNRTLDEMGVYYTGLDTFSVRHSVVNMARAAAKPVDPEAKAKRQARFGTGFKQKYLKYKQKYLELKKQLSMK